MRPVWLTQAYALPTATDLGNALQSRGSQLMVKRAAKQLPVDLAMGTPGSEQIDWHASVMLNLVMQTSYELSLAACK